MATPLRVEPLLGTAAEVVIVATDPAIARSGEHAVISEVARLEAIFTVFDEASALHSFHRTGVTDVLELQTVLELAAQWHRRSGGAFQPAAQQLVDLWDDAAAAGVLPSVETLDRVASHLASSGVDGSFDRSRFNLNAIAKGWIADFGLRSVVDAQPDVVGGWLSLGGDVVHRGDESVAVGIEDPRRPYDNVAPMVTVDVSNEALATSGGARRWWTIGEQQFSKVLDPRTGWPVDHIASATVIAPDGAAADALATVALILPVDETLALVADSGAECFLVHEDGTVTSSSDRFRRA